MAENVTPAAVCGVIMPISAIDGCSASHWEDVLDILNEAIEQAEFESNLVSNADEVGVIQKTIIQNLYDNPIVVCDVSGKNPNVMFELGIRLAFDKPTIIIKDDKTTFSFDTAPIEHLEYPRDLRFAKIVEFKEKLAAKIKATHEKATSDPNYTTFLKHFGEFTVAKLNKKEVSGQEFILEELKSMRSSMKRLEYTQYRNQKYPRGYPRSKEDIDICLGGEDKADIAKAYELASAHPELRDVNLFERSPNHVHLVASVAPNATVTADEIEKILESTRRRRQARKINRKK